MMIVKSTILTWSLANHFFRLIGTPLQVMESHQATKLDVSGTAKAVISCFQKLGVSFDMDEVLFEEKNFYGQSIILFVLSPEKLVMFFFR